MLRVDTATLDDLVAFARAEQQALDVEPWAEVIGYAMFIGLLDAEAAAWLVKAYNAYDDLGSAVRFTTRWPSPDDWVADAPAGRRHAADWPLGRERRNLRGGLVVGHFNSYTTALWSGTQNGWLREAYPPGTHPATAFDLLMTWCRQVWGTGRQAAFEWAEFAGKCLGLPVKPGHGCLWESSGPRESLERIYNCGERAPSQGWLDAAAEKCKHYLAEAGVTLEWWDLETVICDFNVMRKGRYYPGQHLAMIKEEIVGLPEPARSELLGVFNVLIPEPWNAIAPGVDKPLAKAYAETGKIHSPFGLVPR